MAAPCPPADVLAAFAASDLTEQEIRALEHHLGECSDCLAAVACLGQSAGWTSALEAELAPGAKVGRYQILSCVGRGAFGVVYAAYDPDLDRKIALKLLRRRRAEDEERFLRETRAMASVSSPHVVAVHDVGRVEGSLFAAMEFVDGQTLGDWLAERRRTPSSIVGAFEQAGRGLAAAHAMGIVHRDFKPENVLVHGDDRVAVTDFGLARGNTEPLSDAASNLVATTAGPLTVEGTLIGTPLYMSPEGLRRLAVDARSDLFSFCVVLYSALFGAHPFPALTVAELLVAIDRGPQPTRDSRVPRHVKDVVLAGLSADPARRPSSMLALLRALEHDPRRTWGRRVALGVAALAIVVGFVLVRRTREPPARSQCVERGTAIIDDVWGPERQAAVRSGFEELHSPLAHDAAERVERVIDRYARRWQGAWIETCETDVAKPRDPLLARRLACLERRRDQWSSLVETLEHPNERTVVNASSASYALPGVELCADDHWLATFSSPQSDNDRAAAQRAITRAQVFADLGDTEAGLAVLRSPLALAKATEDRALESEARLVEGDLRRAVDPRSAEAPLHAAAIAASAAGRLDVEAAAKVLLTVTLAHSQLRLAEATRAADYAEAAVIRLHEPRLLADYFYARSLAAWAVGGAERSIFIDLVTLATNLAIWGPEHPKVAEAQNSVAASLVELELIEAGLPVQRQALALRERLQGFEHPEALNARGNLAFALAELGHIQEAVTLQEAVAAGRARVLGADSFQLSETWTRLSRLYQWELGRSDDAVAAATRARHIDEQAFGTDAPEGIASLGNLARVLAARGDTEAITASSRALALAEAHLPANHLLVRSTLATHGYVLEQASRCAEAIPVLERLDRASAGALSGRGDLSFGLFALARCESRRSNHELAETILLRALAIREHTRGIASPMIADALVELAAFYEARGRLSEAAAMAERAVTCRANTPGSVLDRARFELAKARQVERAPSR